MPGQLYHTNEILVLLGDNWFAKRSAKQAIEIAERRKQCKGGRQNSVLCRIAEFCFSKRQKEFLSFFVYRREQTSCRREKAALRLGG